MLLDEIFKVALQAIRANKLRSLLTALGIIIGVGAVITMLALGSGAQKAVQDRIAAMGPDLLSIYPGQNFRGGIAIMGNINLTMAKYEEPTSELQSRPPLVCRLPLEKQKQTSHRVISCH